MFLCVTLLTICISIFWIYVIKLNKYWVRRGVKQKNIIPFMVDMLKRVFQKRAAYDRITDIYNTFPDTRYIGDYQFFRPVLMIKDPELIKQLCVKDFEHFLNHIRFLPEVSDPLWNKNLFSLQGQNWKDMRSTLSPSFTGSKMRQMFHLIHETAQNFTEFLTKDAGNFSEIELKDAFTRYTNDAIASTAFGIECDSLKERDNEFFVRGRQTTDLSGFWRSIKFACVVLMPKLGTILNASLFDKEASTFFRKIVKETIDYREKNNVERPDMINLLMKARNNSNDEIEIVERDKNFAAVDEHLEAKPQKRKMDLTLDDITSQALIFFFAGFDTVSSTMCFIAYELATNPDIQKKLIQELDEFRASKHNLTYDNLAELPYLDMVLSETLRKWPPNLITDRSCVKPYTIKAENPDENPVNLMHPDAIWIPIWALHHDPKYWEKPEKFDPERFSPENKEKIVPYTYMPFGVGPRNCIGSRFAIIEVKIVFYCLLEHFEIVPSPKSSIPFVPNKRTFNLASANGFWFGLKRRN